MNHSYSQTVSNQPYAIILHDTNQIRKAVNPYRITNDNKSKIDNTKTQNQSIVQIDINPWSDKEQSRFHDIKVKRHITLQNKHQNKHEFRNIRGDHIVNYLLTEGSSQNPFKTAGINLLFEYTVVSVAGFAINRVEDTVNGKQFELTVVWTRSHSEMCTVLRISRVCIKTFLTKRNCSRRLSWELSEFKKR